MTSSFEDPSGSYLVLINYEDQRSLWPSFADVPPGWTVEFGDAGREECLQYIEAHWTDMRPKSLVQQLEAKSTSGTGPQQ